MNRKKRSLTPKIYPKLSHRITFFYAFKIEKYGRIQFRLATQQVVRVPESTGAPHEPGRYVGGGGWQGQLQGTT